MLPWGRPNIQKLVKKRNIGKLIDALRFKLFSRKEKDKKIRIAAANALGDISDPIAVDPLIDGMNRRETEFMIACTEALIKIGDTRAVEPLKKRWEKTNQKDESEVISKALKILSNIDAENDTSLLMGKISYVLGGWSAGPIPAVSRFRINDAILLCNKVLELEEDHVGALVQKARCFARGNDEMRKEAVEILDRLIEDNFTRGDLKHLRDYILHLEGIRGRY